MRLFKKLSTAVAIPFVLLVTLFIALAINGHNQKKIFILHSYYTDYMWVNDLDAGLESVLGKQNSVQIKRCYMDTKRNPDLSFKKKAGEMARKLIESEKPDVLIAIDDDAQEYAAKYFANSKRTAIIHLGVNNFPEAYEYDKANNVTGLLERIPIKAFIDAANIISKNAGKPNQKIRIVHVGDCSGTVILDDKYIHSYKKLENIEVLPSKLVKTFDQWKKAILDVDSKIDILMLTNSGKQLLENESSKKVVNPKELIDWTLKNCNHPIIGMNSFLVDEGLPFAVSVSPFEFGASGATWALKIINDKIPTNEVSKNFPTMTSKKFIVSMNQKQLEELNWNLPQIYKSFASAIQRCF